MKYIAKKILSDYKQHCLILLHVKTMETYCVSYKKNPGNENSSVRKTKQNRLMLLIICSVCGHRNESLLKINKLIKQSF